MDSSGLVVTGRGLNDWMATDSDEFDPLTLDDAELRPVSDYDADALRADVLADRDLLRAYAAEARGVRWEDDPKLARPAEELATIAVQAAEEGYLPSLERDCRKVIIFSYYADTVEWLSGYLEQRIGRDKRLAAYRNRMAVISGRQGDRADVLWGFAPRTTDAPAGRRDDLHDVLVTTDVLAEGVNLQQARNIVNYDLPWNPMRLVQRHGRIDRIGSPHSRVYLRCYFPDEKLDALLGLEQRLLRKIAQAAAAVGVEGEIIPGSAFRDQNYADTRQEIMRLRAQDPELFELGGEKGDAYSGEAFRQELRRGLEPSSPFSAAVRGLAWGSGSGLARPGAVPGYVFCARVGDHPSPQFKYVAYEEPGATPSVVDPVAAPSDSVVNQNPAPAAEPEIIADTLTCLLQAEATPDTPRVLDEATHARAYDAWALARDHICREWLKATDPRNLLPKVPRTMHDAADLLRRYPPAELPQAELERLIEAVEAPYAPSIQKAIRDAMRSDGTPTQQAAAVAAAAAGLGLEPSAPPEVLPVIGPEDVHLVCWIAIVPEEPAATATLDSEFTPD